MTDRRLRLSNLVELANEPSSEKRRALLRAVTDAFLAEPESLTPQQNWQFGEIMAQLAYDLERQVREELANRLAAEGNAPRALIRRLAHDEIHVARPVLQQSPVLTQQDLLEVAHNRSQDHLHAITARTDIEADLSEALATLGNDAVVVGLLRNEQAEIRHETFARIVDRSDDSMEIQHAVIDRSNVPKEILKSLLDRVSDKVRHRVLERFADIGSRQLDAVVAAMKRKMDRKPMCSAERVIADLARRGALDDAALSRFIVEERPMEFLVGLARLAGMDLETVRRALAETSGTPLAILCRASGIGHGLFKQIAFSTVSCMPASPTHVLPLVQAYVKLDKGSAQRTIRFWRSRRLAVEELGRGGAAPGGSAG